MPRAPAMPFSQSEAAVFALSAFFALGALTFGGSAGFLILVHTAAGLALHLNDRFSVHGNDRMVEVQFALGAERRNVFTCRVFFEHKPSCL